MPRPIMQDMLSNNATNEEKRSIRQIPLNEVRRGKLSSSNDRPETTPRPPYQPPRKKNSAVMGWIVFGVLVIVAVFIIGTFFAEAKVEVTPKATVMQVNSMITASEQLMSSSTASS